MCLKVKEYYCRIHNYTKISPHKEGKSVRYTVVIILIPGVVISILLRMYMFPGIINYIWIMQIFLKGPFLASPVIYGRNLLMPYDDVDHEQRDI